MEFIWILIGVFIGHIVNNIVDVRDNGKFKLWKSIKETTKKIFRFPRIYNEF